MDSPAIGSTTSMNATANSAIFNTLPPELRRHILIHAFGGRKIHVYQSSAFVCHYRRPEADDFVNPTTDNCLHSSDPRLNGGRQALGAEGWLMSCRLAYVFFLLVQVFDSIVFF